MRGAPPEQAKDLLEDAGTRRLRQVFPGRDHRVVHVGGDAEVEAGRELDGAQDTDRILAEAGDRLADRVDRPPPHVLHAAAPVEDLAAIEVVKQGVHREVAPQRVFVGLAEDVVAPDEEVVEHLARFFLGGLHRRVAPEGGDLDDLSAPEQDVRQAEAPADDPAVAEEGAHVLRAGARGDVEILGFSPEQEVADAPADKVGLVAAALEAPDHLRGIGIDAVVVQHHAVADQARARVALEGVAATSGLLRGRLDDVLDRV